MKYRSYYEDDHDSPFIFIVGLMILIVFIAAGLTSCNKYIGKETVIATVTDKTVKRSGSDEDKYLVYVRTKDNVVEVFEITDALFFGRFDSSTTYGSIEVGSTYEFTVRGKRNEFLSMYPNIYEFNTIDDVGDTEETTESSAEVSETSETIIVDGKVYCHVG